MSHSTTEAEIISLDIAIRMEGLSALCLWDLVLEVMDPKPDQKPALPDRHRETISWKKMMADAVDDVPPSLAPFSCRSDLIVLDDNEATIKICNKGRSLQLRHVPRVHRVDLDWLFERVRDDKHLTIRFVGTK